MIFDALRQHSEKLQPTTITYRCYTNFEADNFNFDLQSAPFQLTEIFSDPDDCHWYFEKLFTDILDKHAPIKTKKVRAKQPPYMNSDLRKAALEKARLRRKYNRYPTKDNWESYRKQRNKTTDIRKKSIKNYFMERCVGWTQKL